MSFDTGTVTDKNSQSEGDRALTESVPSVLWVRRDSGASSKDFDTSDVPDGVPRPIAEALVARGISGKEAVTDWFRPTLKTLKDPSVLTDMDRAVERLLKAREEQETIVLYADYDLDGTSGLALALTAFQALGFEKVVPHQPQRLVEGYGLHSSSIQKLFDEHQCSLIVSIDLGITGNEEVEFARSLGIDVIVTDHHLPGLTLPNAVAVVNPNRGNCESGLSHLCGTGVMFYLVLALRRALRADHFDPKSLLDCFAIGTITDMVPLIEENRILVKHGLVKLAETQRPGLRILLQELGLSGRPLTAQDVAIRYAPKLNALSRMGSGVQPIDLYLVDSEAKARELVVRVLANNQERQASQKSADDEANRLLKENPPNGAIVIASDKFHRGGVGLVATRLTKAIGLPALVGAIEGERRSVIGSARLRNGMSANLLDAMTFANQSEDGLQCLDQFGGHAVAAGFELRADRLLLFRERISAFFTERLTARSSAPVVEYDADCQISDFNPSFMAWLDAMGPFGAKAPVPLFRIRTCSVVQVKELRGGHLRLKLAQPGIFQTLTAVWFSPSAKRLEEVPLSVGCVISVLAEAQWNHFQGSRDIQLLVHDIAIEGN
ncbi:MAG: single-stranded-DNA-specific exonuclease RecJ [Bdellovibrionales bacterium]|nr:single-stranded-DNA-specific exonuclease RecJ [Bdellovibrionales bacterium]